MKEGYRIMFSIGIALAIFCGSVFFYSFFFNGRLETNVFRFAGVMALVIAVLVYRLKRPGDSEN